MGVPAGPAVSSSSSFLRDKDIFWVIELGIGAILDGVDDLDREGSTLGSRSTRMDLGM